MNYKKKAKNRDISLFFWLLTLTIMVFLLILIGGLTRLTDSGLSMVNWQPIMGSIPPLNADSWASAFESYKRSPEYLIVNKNMILSEFKYIFWWEWSHRFFARCIGIILIFPMLFFILKKRISKKLFVSILVLLGFGLIQALVGWWMVKSGLNQNPYVSQYRLAFHLTNALIIFSILIWLTLNSWSNLEIKFIPQNNLEKLNIIILFLIFITIISGAFMAGTDAGKSYNTYPLMNGELIPENYFIIKNIAKNFFENTVAINFNHRWLATLAFIGIIFFSFYLFFIRKLTKCNLGIMLIFSFAILQFFLGIFTLMTNVKIILASMHQMNSTLLLGSLLYLYHSIKRKGNFNVI